MMDRLLAMLRPARVRLVDDTDVVQRVQIDEGPVAPTGARRIIDRVKVVGLFGLHSVPPLDSDALVVGMGGDRSRSVVVGTNHQSSRPTDGQPGDSGLYDNWGHRLKFTEAGVELDAGGDPVTIRNASVVTLIATEKVAIDAPLVEVTHDLHIGGALQVAGTVEAGDAITGADAIYARGGAVELAGLHDIYDGHTHGGVKAGSDTSAGPNQKA